MSNPFHQDNASQQGDDLTLAQVAQPESSFAYSEPDYTPPIGIAYLLILTTGFAIYFALESFFGRFEQAATIAQFVEWSSLVLYAICFAMTFASIWLFIQKKQRIGKFVTQPGHKLFLFLSIYFVLQFFPRIARHFFLMEEAGFLTNEFSSCQRPFLFDHCDHSHGLCSVCTTMVALGVCWIISRLDVEHVFRHSFCESFCESG